VTGYTVHTGTNKKFADGWERVFGKAGAKAAPKATAKPAKQPAAGKKRGSK
jgi:hypothetical protein